MQCYLPFQKNQNGLRAPTVQYQICTKLQNETQKAQSRRLRLVRSGVPGSLSCVGLELACVTNARPCPFRYPSRLSLHNEWNTPVFCIGVNSPSRLSLHSEWNAPAFRIGVNPIFDTRSWSPEARSLRANAINLPPTQLITKARSRTFCVSSTSYNDVGHHEEGSAATRL